MLTMFDSSGGTRMDVHGKVEEGIRAGLVWRQK